MRDGRPSHNWGKGRVAGKPSGISFWTRRHLSGHLTYLERVPVLGDNHSHVDRKMRTVSSTESL